MLQHSSAVTRALCAATALVALMFVSASPASAVTINADAPSLGAIPDSPAGGTECGDYTAGPRDVTFTVTGFPAGSPANVGVGFSLAAPGHPFVGDLEVVLIAPGGAATKSIIRQTSAAGATDCGDNSNVLGPYTFSDDAPEAPTWWGAATTTVDAAAIPAGSYRASTPGGAAGGGANTPITPAFAGLPSANGTWTLRFRDGGQGDLGNVSAATLTLGLPVLTVTKTGTGLGTVTGMGIDCGLICTGSYAKNTTVPLTAVPAAGSTFAGWTGCDAATGNECTVVMSGNRTASATFNVAPGGGQSGTGTQARQPDTIAPNTTLGKHPKAVTSKHKAKFTFSADEPGSTFLCKLDKGAFKACVSPFKKSVGPGQHSFKVKAVDSSGNTDATPAKYKFKVED